MSSTTGTCTVTEQTFGSVKRIIFNWVCGASSQAGVIPATSTTNYYDGKVLQVVTCPDSTKAPDANYDLELNDKDSVDQFCGSGANRHTSSTEVLVHSSSQPLGVAIATKLALAISNGGSSGSGRTFIYIR